jgi:uroporphyrinogen decarboxylase
MTRKERFMAAVKGWKPDRVPVFDFLSSKKLFKYTNGRDPVSYEARDIMECSIKLGLDAAFIPFGGFAGYILDVPEHLKGKALKKDQYVDEWGTVYQHNDFSWPADAPVDYPVKNRKELSIFKVPDAYAPGRIDGINKAIEMNKGYDAAILGGINGPFTVTLLAMGVENMSIASLEDPYLITEIMKKANEFLIPAAEIMIKAGVDGVFIADDLGHRNGVFFRPEYMKEFVFPEIARLVSQIKKLNNYALFHSCGNITDVFGDLVETGVHAVHPIQKSAGMDLKSIKSRYGKRVCLIGNVDSTNTLPHGTVSDVRRDTIECMNIGAPGGGFILASDSDLRDDMPVENMISMIETAKEYADYCNFP